MTPPHLAGACDPARAAFELADQERRLAERQRLEAELRRQARDFRERALHLHDAGLRVFPVVGGEARTPGIAKLHGPPLPSPHYVRYMPWDRAVDVGVSLPLGYLVLDIDVKSGKRGAGQLQALEELYGPLPVTARQDTRTGGWHLLFDISAMPPDIAFRPSVRSTDGGPSHIDIIHANNRYVVAYDDGFFLDESTPIAPLPEDWWPLVTRLVER